MNSMFNFCRVYASFLGGIGLVLAYSVHIGYMHNFCILTCLTIFG